MIADEVIKKIILPATKILIEEVKALKEKQKKLEKEINYYQFFICFLLFLRIIEELVIAFLK